MYKHLLYILNNTETDVHSLAGALQLAAGMEAHLTLVAFAPKMPDSLKGYEQDFHLTLARRAEDTLNAARTNTHSATDVTTHIEVAHTRQVSQWVAEAVNTRGIDLVVKEKNLHNPLFDFLSTDMALAHKSPCSLLFLRPDRPLRSLPRRIILALAVDGLHSQEDLQSSMALRLAKTGQTLVQHFNSHLTLLSCYSDGMLNMLNAFSQGNIDPEDQHRWQSQMVDDQENLLVQLATLAGIDAPDIVQVRGNPDEGIMDYVSHKPIDLLVIGAVARPLLTKLLIGSTAEELLRTPPAHLLLVKG